MKLPVREASFYNNLSLCNVFCNPSGTEALTEL